MKSKIIYGLQSIWGVFNGLILVLHTIIWGCPVIVFGVIKLSSKNERWQIFWTPPIVWLCSTWAHICVFLESLLIRIDFKCDYQVDELSVSKSYLVICNHQSMADVPVLMKSIHGKIPFMRFFAKAQLKKLPIFGFAWHSVGCPFMQRYSKEFLEKNPHLKGQDLAETIESCRRLRHAPVAITNFIEGTRFTVRKHEKDGKAYHYLLSPRAGGLALAIAALEGQLKTMIDVTIHYHEEKTHELWDYLSGRVKTVSIHVRTIPIPDDFHLGDYQNDPIFREQFQSWLNHIWFEKDQKLKAYH